MYLGNPLLPINVSVASAADSIKKKIEDKNWHEYELAPLKLNLVPYFLFNYHYFIEHENSGKSIVKNTVTGVLALDAHEVEVREDLTELLKHNWKKSTVEIPRGEFVEKWNNVEKREQDEVLKMKTAEHFEVPKQNVVVSSPKKLMFPAYKTTLKAGKKEYALIISAIDGSIWGIEKLPEREKGRIEITRETIHELKKPSAWIKYSKEAILEGLGLTKETVNGKKEKKTEQAKKNSAGINLSFLDSKLILVIIMLLGILLIILGIFRIKLL